MPFGSGSGAHFAENWAGDQVALDIEVVVDGITDGQKSLHRAGRLIDLGYSDTMDRVDAILDLLKEG